MIDDTLEELEAYRRAAMNAVMRRTVKLRLAQVTPQEARRHMRRMMSLVPPMLGTTVIEREIPQLNHKIPLHWITGRNVPIFQDAAAPRPVVLYLHGGAFIMGCALTHRNICSALSAESGMLVVAPEYRLAPEDPFPSGLQDCLTVYKMLLGKGYKADQIALAGDSAGGGLCFSLLLKLQELGHPLPAAIVGFCPWLDLTLSGKSSSENIDEDPMLPIQRAAEIVEYYTSHHDESLPLISPLFAEFKQMPPVLLQCSSIELIRDDARRKHEKLLSRGFSSTLTEWPDLPHAWQVSVPFLKEARQAIEEAGVFLKEHIARPS